jgi:hypothetical protein
VDILFSEDNNTDFESVVLSNTANDGSATVTVPQVNTDRARFMVRCSNQRFYALSPESITIMATTPNTAPVATDDALTVNENSGQVAIDVLSNDSDADSDDSISLLSIDYTGNSSVSISGSQLLYQPASNFSGSDTITYTIADESGAQDSGLLTVTVRAATTTSGSSSGGGGGGGSFPVWGLALLLLAGVLSGCQNPTTTVRESVAEPDATLAAEAEDSLEADLNTALAQGDYRLLMISGRRPTMPGVDSGDLERLTALCGTRFLSGTGDHLKNLEQAAERKRQRDYAFRYNQKMSQHCHSQMK